MSLSHFRGPTIQEAVPEYQEGVSILKIIGDGLRRRGDNVAMIEGDTGESISSSCYLEKISRITTGLQQAGVSPGDLVIFCCDKSILAISLLLGTVMTGATAVLAPPPNADMIDKLTAGQVVKALFYDTAFSESVNQSVARMSPPPSLLCKADIRDPIITSLLKSPMEFKEIHVEDITKHVPFVFFSSGTTGNPKGIEVSDIGAQLAGVLFRHTPKSLLHASPLYWYSALCFILGSIIKDYPLILTNSKDARNRLQLIEKYKVETFFCNMALMIQHNNEAVYDDINLSSVGQVIVGGETVLPSVVRPFFTRVMKGRASLITLYGSTEAGIIADLKVSAAALGSMKLSPCGKPGSGVEIKILDDHGGLVETGVVGKIFVKTMATKGYWLRDDLNRTFLDSEGFYQTGDVGCFDSEGHLYVWGRICDLISYKGSKNSPALLEDLLMDHPAVCDAVVIGTPHPSDGHLPTAFVVLRQKYKGTVSENDIRTYIDERVEDSMRLRGGVHFRDSLPRVSNGKVIRNFILGR